MKLNLKVRLRNPVFWLTVVPAIVSLVYLALGLLDIVPSISSDDVVQYISVAISALTTLGVFVDPTTKGVNDSARAMLYDKPNDGSFVEVEEDSEIEYEVTEK